MSEPALTTGWARDGPWKSGALRFNSDDRAIRSFAWRERSREFVLTIERLLAPGAAS